MEISIANSRFRRISLRPEILKGGITGGIVSGLAMGVVGMVYSLAAGTGAFLPLKLIAASVFGVTAILGGPGVVFVGLVLHLVISAFWGTVFARLNPLDIPAGTVIGNGVLFGIIVWAIMTFLALPVVDPTMYQRIGLSPGMWFFQHLVYGAFLIFVPEFCKSFAAPKPVNERKIHLFGKSDGYKKSS